MSETTEPGKPADPIRPGDATSPVVPPTPDLGPDAAAAAAPLNRLAPGDAATRFGGSAPFSGIPDFDGTRTEASPVPEELGFEQPGTLRSEGLRPQDEPAPPASPVQEWLAAKPDLATGVEPSLAQDLAIGRGGDASTGAGLASDGPAAAPEQPPATLPDAPAIPATLVGTIDLAAIDRAEAAIPATLVGSVDPDRIRRAEALAGRPADLPAGWPNDRADPEPMPLAGDGSANQTEPPTAQDPPADLPSAPSADPFAIPLWDAGADPKPPRPERAPAEQPVPATLVMDRRPEEYPVPATLVGTVAPQPPDEQSAPADAITSVPSASESFATAVPIPSSVEPELAVSDQSIPVTIAGETGAPPAEPIPVGPVMTMPAEPTPIDLAAIPVEPANAIPVAALAATAGGAAATAAAAGGAHHEAHHDQTAAEVFAHAHEDVEHRKGFLSYGVLTKTAGVAGLIACVVGLAVMLAACAGLVPARRENLLVFNWHLKWTAIGVGGLAVLLLAGSFLWKAWRPTAIGTAIIALMLGGAWFAVGQYHERIEGFNALIVSPYIVYAGAGGLALALLGGLIEHRRMREETHVLAALFTNAIAAIGGALLWVVQIGWKII